MIPVAKEVGSLRAIASGGIVSPTVAKTNAGTLAGNTVGKIETP